MSRRRRGFADEDSGLHVVYKAYVRGLRLSFGGCVLAVGLERDRLQVIHKLLWGCWSMEDAVSGRRDWEPVSRLMLSCHSRQLKGINKSVDESSGFKEVGLWCIV